MSLSKEQLIEKISEVSKLDKELVAKELELFIEQILQVSKGNPLTIEGLGIFRLKKGRLSLETAPNLALEINYKYAGMLPLEVKKGNGSLADQDNQNAEEVTFTDDDEQGETGSKSAKEDLGFEIGKVKPVEKKKEEEISEPKQEKAKAEIKVTEPTLVDVVLPKIEEKLVTKSEETPKIVAKPKVAQKSNKSKSIVAFIVAIIVTVLVVQFLKNSTPESKIADKAKVEIKSTPELESPKLEEVKPIVVEPQKAEPVEVVKPEMEIPQTSSTQYGLNGDFRAENPSYYGIILYTLSFESRANAESETLIKKGFRAYVQKWTITKENIKYRVAVGQFATVEDAKQAAITLPAPFNDPKQHFIKRLNP